jgi:hypothetical protein
MPSAQTFGPATVFAQSPQPPTRQLVGVATEHPAKHPPCWQNVPAGHRQQEVFGMQRLPQRFLGLLHVRRLRAAKASKPGIPERAPSAMAATAQHGAATGELAQDFTEGSEAFGVHGSLLRVSGA